MSESANQKAEQHLDEIFDLFSVELEDETRYPGTKKEIEEAQIILDKIDAQEVDDPDIQESIQDYKDGQNEYLKREFVGTKWFFIVIGLWILLNVYNAAKEFSHDFTLESATSLLRGETARAERYIAEFDDKADKKDYEKDYLKQHKKVLKRNKKMSPEDYLSYLESRNRKWATKKIFRQLFWVGMLAAYFYTSLTPKFLIVKRRKQLEFMKKSGGFLSKFIFGILGVFLAMPNSETTVTKFTDGSKTSETSFVGLFIKVIAIGFVLLFVLFAMMYILPWLVVVNYLRNYQFEKVEMYFDQLVNKIKSMLGKGTPISGEGSA